MPAYAEMSRELAEKMPEELPEELPDVLLMPEIEAQEPADKISKQGADRALRLRWSKGRSQTRCAKALGVDRKTVEKWLKQGREDYREDWAAFAARWDLASSKPLEEEEDNLKSFRAFQPTVYRLSMLAPDEFSVVTEGRQVQADVRELTRVDLSGLTDDELARMAEEEDA